MGLSELKADCKTQRQRLAKLSPGDIDARLELLDNILPLFEGLIDTIQDDVVSDVADLAGAVDELIDQSSDVLHPETTAKILGVFEVGKLICSELEAMIQGLDDVSKKRIVELTDGYREGVEIMTEVLAECTLDADQMDSDDEESDEDESEGGE